MTPAEAIAAQLSLFVHPQQWTELRALHVGQRGRTIAGWFRGDRLFDLARTALAVTRQAAGVYFIPNPVSPELAAKRQNDASNCPKGFALTHDTDVTERRFLIVDIDPRRFTEAGNQDCPSSAAELVFARAVARDHVRPYLRAKGWPDPVVMLSGNGVHLVYQLRPALPVARWGRAGDPCAETLRIIAERFGCTGAAIDPNTFNPCRMLKVPGTLARKGEATAGRPHRPARILEVPDGWRQPDAPPVHAEPAERVEPRREVGAARKPAARNHATDAPALFDGGPDLPARH